MRKLTLLLLALCLAALPALAEETQRIQCSTFSVDLPTDWAVDVDEFTLAAYPIVDHILHPTMVFAGDEDYALIVTVYNYDTNARYAMGGSGSKAQEHFDLLSGYLGLNNGRVQPSTVVQSRLDSRNFVLAHLTGTEDYLATYYNQERGQGYTFRLRVKNAAIASEEAESLLLDLISSLRENGYFYPADATGHLVVVTEGSANIRTAPDPNSDRIRTAYQGESFPHYGQQGSWYIINVDGQTGYISTGLTALQ